MSAATFASISSWPLRVIYARFRGGALWTNIFKIHNDSFISNQRELGFRCLELMHFFNNIWKPGTVARAGRKYTTAAERYLSIWCNTEWASVCVCVGVNSHQRWSVNPSCCFVVDDCSKVCRDTRVQGEICHHTVSSHKQEDFFFSLFLFISSRHRMIQIIMNTSSPDDFCYFLILCFIKNDYYIHWWPLFILNSVLLL